MNNTKVKVKGVNGRSTRPMSYDHVTTIDFNVVKPFGIWEMVPGDKIDLKPEIWMRTQNMACPTFGKVDCITRAFFVPHRLVMEHFLDFWSSNSFRENYNVSTKINEAFKVSNKALSDAYLARFVGNSTKYNMSYVDVDEWDDGSVFSLTFGVWMQNGSATDDKSDFEVHYPATHTHYRFNPLGKRVWDLLYSMGYRFNFTNTSLDDNYNNGTAANDYPVSMLPILSFLKIFSDWYVPSEFKYLFNVDYLSHQNSFYTEDLESVFDMLSYAAFLWYNDDIFSLCEHQPYTKQNAQQSGLFSRSRELSQYTLPENDLIAWNNSAGLQVRNYKSIGTSANATTLTGQDPNWLVNSWTVRAVQRVSNLLMKNNLLSHRAQDYLKAKFGVNPSAARLDVSEYIGSASAPVKISDVVSTEASDGKLGELGGKGTSYQIQNLNYTAEEFGYFMVLIELRPRVDYGQGVNPLVLRVEHEDFWQEETDGLGFTPVPTECLAAGPASWNRLNSDYVGSVFNRSKTENRIFGYLPKYWSYKISKGNLSGDFGIPKNQDIQSYHLMRTVDGRSLDDYVHNSLKFRYPGLCFFENEYNRIFMNPDTSTLRDHFQLIGSFDCFINGYPLGLSESWQVNPDGEERQGSEHHIQSVL